METCSVHQAMEDLTKGMKTMIEEMGDKISQIHECLVGTYEKRGLIGEVKETNADIYNRLAAIESAADRRIKELEDWKKGIEKIYNTFLLKAIGALATAAVAGGVVSNAIRSFFDK